MYILENIFNDGLRDSSIKLISILSVISGILVIVSKNPVKSVLFLIGLFLTISLYLFTLNMSFIALTYLLVYVGAVSILFLFILMLINIRVSELSTDNSNSIPLSIIIITIFSFIFSNKSFYSTNDEKLAFIVNTQLNGDKLDKQSINEGLFFVEKTNEKVFLVFSSAWDSVLAEMSHISSLGNVIYVYYSIGILIIGLILLLATVGAISVTTKSNNKIN